MMLVEVKTMANLSHLNILKQIGFNDNGLLIKKDGREVPVFYAVIELAPGGELFDYISLTDRFSESLARHYMKQLLAGLSHCHQSGITHRDLKPENLLFDSNYNLMIADFGFAAPVGGKTVEDLG